MRWFRTHHSFKSLMQNNLRLLCLLKSLSQFRKQLLYWINKAWTVSGAVWVCRFRWLIHLLLLTPLKRQIWIKGSKNLRDKCIWLSKKMMIWESTSKLIRSHFKLFWSKKIPKKKLWFRLLTWYRVRTWNWRCRSSGWSRIMKTSRPRSSSKLAVNKNNPLNDCLLLTLISASILHFLK